MANSKKTLKEKKEFPKTVTRRKRLKRPGKVEIPLWEQEDPVPPQDLRKYRTGSDYNKKFNTMSIQRGKDVENKYKLHAWDAVQDCSKEKCPVYNRCEKVKKGPCKVISDYLQNVMGFVINNFRPVADEKKLFHFGMHVLPLYKMLARLKLKELGSEDVNFALNMEIRRTVAAIEKSWKECGLNTVSVYDPPPNNPKQNEPGNWYDLMSSV